MISANTQSEAASLNGLALGEAFLTFVLGSAQVTAISSRLLKEEPKFTPIFAQGELPGITRRFDWPLSVSAEELAVDFDRPIGYDYGVPWAPPLPLVVAVAKAMAERINKFQEILASGTVVARGTSEKTHAECVVSIGQWARRDLRIDIENSSIGVAPGSDFDPVWTGVWLETRSDHVAPASAGEFHSSKEKKQAQTLITSSNKFAAWFKSIVSDPEHPLLSRQQVIDHAKEEWGNTISIRTIDVIRRQVLEGDEVSSEQRELWTKPGPKLNSPQS